jgi:hypothetical protein
MCRIDDATIHGLGGGGGFKREEALGLCLCAGCPGGGERAADCSCIVTRGKKRGGGVPLCYQEKKGSLVVQDMVYHFMSLSLKR